MKKWPIYKAEEFCFKVTDGTHDSPKPQLEGRRLITSKHLKGNYIDFDSAKLISEADYQKVIARSKVDQWDILFSMIGTIGNIYLERNPIAEYACKNVGIFKFNGDKDKALWMYYWLKSPQVRDYVYAQLRGSTQAYLPLGGLREMPVAVPAIETQRKIAAILSALDDKIELNRRINANLEQQAAAIYSQMFVETPNNDRKIVPAGEFFDISIGKTPPRKELRWFSENPEDCVWVSISDMGNCGLYIGESSEYLTREAVDKHNVKIVPDNTVILSFKLTVGRVAITDGELTTNEAIAHFKTDFPKINEYLYFYLKYFNYNELGSTSSIATAVNSKIVKTLPFVVPTDDEIERFHQIAAVFFEQIKTNQYEIVRLTAVRDALLPRLMSGEIDVSDVSL